MAVVSQEQVVQGFLESSSVRQIRYFVAACSERLAGLFTGVVASPDRARDIDLFVDSLDLLWGVQEDVDWSALHSSVGLFPELQGAEEPGGELAYAADAAATLYYALRFGATHDLVDAASCSNHALNSAGFASDWIADEVDRYRLELENQSSDISVLSRLDVFESDGGRDIQRMRDRARRIARERLLEIRAIS